MISSKAFVGIWAYVTLCILGTTNHALANTQDYGIEVNGQSSVFAEPDRFALSVSIVEKGRLTDKIRMIVDHKSDQVVNVAKGLGIATKDINSARVSLRVIEDESKITAQGIEVNQAFPNDKQGKLYLGGDSVDKTTSISPQYFELSRYITVNFKDIKDYDKFLNSVVKLGVAGISPLTMSINDTDDYYQQALAQAISNAKSKAEQIAKQSNQKLGDLVFVKELSTNNYRARFSSPMMSANATYGHNSQVGNQAINANVLVKYSFK